MTARPVIQAERVRVPISYEGEDYVLTEPPVLKQLEFERRINEAGDDQVLQTNAVLDLLEAMFGGNPPPSLREIGGVQLARLMNGFQEVIESESPLPKKATK